MAIIKCEAGIQLFNTSQMGNELKQAYGIKIPEATLNSVEESLPPVLEAATAKFCQLVCNETGELFCQAIMTEPKLVSSFIAAEVLLQKLDEELKEPDPGDNGHLSAPSPYIQ